MAWVFGYNTNGFAHHRLEDAVEILAELGYGAIGITLDYGHLNPFDANLSRAVADLDRRLRKRRLRCVVETGARFLLDPRHKHQPTLLSPREADRKLRSNFLETAIRIAGDLGADAVSLWSGVPESTEPRQVNFERLVAGLEGLLHRAEICNVPLAFEPEPGMLIDTLQAAAELFELISHDLMQLTIDVGHLHCQREGEIAAALNQWALRLGNVHLDDIKAGIHDHLMFGEGEIDFPPVLAALTAMDYQLGAYVELSRHSHDAVAAARQAMAFLQSARLASAARDA